MSHVQLQSELIAHKNLHDAAFLQRFFKTGPGEYGEGDSFLGLRVPLVRAKTKEYYKILSHSDIQSLLKSPWHEVRLSGVIAMTYQYPKGDIASKDALYRLYIHNIGTGINNWDLIDVSCPHIIGAHIYQKNRSDLFTLAKGGLWQKRTSIISTFYFLRRGDIADTFKLAELLVNEQHDLLQKAVGWALREMGKVDSGALYSFLDTYAATMPRTMLRYSLERLPKDRKMYYMHAKQGIKRVDFPPQQQYYQDT